MAQRIAKFFILTKGIGINLFYFLFMSFFLSHTQEVFLREGKNLNQTL